jgi:signal transduction histidine kinase
MGQADRGGSDEGVRASSPQEASQSNMRSLGEVVLQRSLNAAGYRDVIGSMLEEVDRLTRLVENLLTLTRAESGRIPLTRDLVDLGELAASVADNLRVLAEEKEQSLRIDTGLASARGATLRWFAWA